MAVNPDDPKMEGYIPLQDFIDKDGDHPSRRIRDTSFGRKKEELQISVDSLIFPNTGTGYESPSQVIVLTNVGYDDVHIYGTTLKGDFVLKSEVPSLLKAGEVASVQIAFAPPLSGSIGPKTGSIYFDTGNAAGDELVELVGEAILGVPEDIPEGVADLIDKAVGAVADSLVDEVEAARDKARDWAESDNPPAGPGTESAKTAANRASSERENAEAAAATAAQHANLALTYKDAAASAAGVVGIYDTLAAANAAIGSIPNNGGVTILNDGANNGFYVKEGGVLVKKSSRSLAAMGEFANTATFVNNWNTIAQSGIYRSNSSGAAPEGGPGNYGHMIVEHTESTAGRAFQMAYRTNSTVIAPYFRARDGDGVWGPWRQLLSDTPQSLMPSVLTTRDLTDQYPDPEMEDLSFYTLTGAETLSRTSGPANRRSAYHIFHELVAVETSIVSGLFPASAGLSYLASARTSFTTGLPVDRTVYIDWFSDYAGTELISSSEIATWTGTALGRRTTSVEAPVGTVRARFRAVKSESVDGTRIIISEYSFKKQVAAEDVVSGAVLPSKLTTRDFNSYPDPSMEDLSLYTMTGADNLIRFASASWPYIYNNDAQSGEVVITSPVIPITGDTAYEFGGRLSFTNSLPVVRELWIDWYSDLAATELLDSSLFSRWEQYESAYRTMVVRSPGGAVRARLRAVKLASDVPSRILVASLSVRPIPASDESVRFADERARRSMEINGNLLSGGGFPRTADQDLETIFGGNTNRQRPPLAAMDLGECMFIPPTEEQMNFAGPTVPLMAWSGGTFRMIPMDIRTSLFGTIVGPPLFNPHLTNNSGILVFNYFRTDPIHTIMKGSIDMMAMVSRDDPDARMRYILGIKGFNTPYIEKGQGGARRYLAQSIPYGDTAKRILDVEAYNDLCAPIDDFILSQFASGSPNLYAGSDHGFLNSSQVDTWIVDPATGLYLSDDSGTVGPEVQTTKWIDISDYDPLDHVYAITFDGTSNRSRIQWRDATGNIYYFTGHSLDRSSYRLIRLPRKAVAFRVYYTGRNQTAGDNNVDIRALTGQALDYDPLKGYFQNFHFSVNRDVTFWPGAAYGFFIFQQRFAGSFPTAADTPEWGFRFQSGGLSMLFDAGRMRRTMATNFYRAV